MSFGMEAFDRTTPVDGQHILNRLYIVNKQLNESNHIMSYNNFLAYNI